MKYIGHFDLTIAGVGHIIYETPCVEDKSKAIRLVGIALEHQLYLVSDSSEYIYKVLKALDEVPVAQKVHITGNTNLQFTLHCSVLCKRG